MTDQQRSIKLRGAELNKYISLWSLPVSKSQTWGQRVKNPGSVFESQPTGHDLGGLPAATKRAGQDQVKVQIEFANAGRLLFHPGAANIAQFPFGVGGVARFTRLNGNPVPHQV